MIILCGFPSDQVSISVIKFGHSSTGPDSNFLQCGLCNGDEGFVCWGQKQCDVIRPGKVVGGQCFVFVCYVCYIPSSEKINKLLKFGGHTHKVLCAVWVNAL